MFQNVRQPIAETVSRPLYKKLATRINVNFKYEKQYFINQYHAFFCLH